jgi:hypothetical protein
MDIAEMIRNMASSAAEEERPPALDIIPVPPQHVRTLYLKRVAKEQNDAKDRDPALQRSSFLVHREFWTWLESVVPATMGKRTRIDYRNPMSPTIEILGDQAPPYRQDDGTDAAYVHVPQGTEEEGEIIQLMHCLDTAQGDAERQLAHYDLWTKLIAIYPVVNDGNWRLRPTNTDGLYIVRAQDEE